MRQKSRNLYPCCKKSRNLYPSDKSLVICSFLKNKNIPTSFNSLTSRDFVLGAESAGPGLLELVTVLLGQKGEKKR